MNKFVKGCVLMACGMNGSGLQLAAVALCFIAWTSLINVGREKSCRDGGNSEETVDDLQA